MSSFFLLIIKALPEIIFKKWLKKYKFVEKETKYDEI
jgi:hypothetical protein